MESQEELQKAREMDNLLEENYYSSCRHLLYRSDTTNAQTWKIKEIRSRRKPMSTPSYLDAIIMQLERDHYPHLPMRSRSKFAVEGNNQLKLSMYSGSTEICFPRKNADIYSLDEDSFTAYFSEARTHIEKGLYRYDREKRDVDLPKVIERFLEIFNNEFVGRQNEMYSDTMEFISNNWNELREESRDANSIKGNKHEKFIGNRIYRFLRNLNSYFQNLEKGVQAESEEVIFNGSDYLLVDVGFFNEFFDWYDKRWQLKKHYEK